MNEQINPYESPKTYENDRWKWIRRGLVASVLIGSLTGYFIYSSRQKHTQKQGEYFERRFGKLEINIETEDFAPMQ